MKQNAYKMGFTELIEFLKMKQNREMNYIDQMQFNQKIRILL